MAQTRAAIGVAGLVRGLANGAAAYLLGYLVALTTAAETVGRSARAFEPLASAGARFVPEWKVAAWTYADAHFVGTVYAGRTVNLVSFASVEYLALVPPAVLLLVGAALSLWLDARTPRDGFVAGTTAAVGYLPVAVLFAVLSTHATVGSGLLRTVVLAGLVYPVAFGGTGGLLSVLGRRTPGA